MIGNYDFLPCTPAGVMELIHSTGISVSGKECVVIGRSNIVGKPMAMLLLHENGTVTICHSRTQNLAEVTRRADILVSAVGRAKFVTADMVKPGAVVIDVGMNRDENGKLCGDVDFAAVEPIASYITPVPGGVGPMTITTVSYTHLLQNKIEISRADRFQRLVSFFCAAGLVVLAAAVFWKSGYNASLLVTTGYLLWLLFVGNSEI